MITAGASIFSGIPSGSCSLSPHLGKKGKKIRIVGNIAVLN
jgi:hypothetical protein